MAFNCDKRFQLNANNNRRGNHFWSRLPRRGHRWKSRAQLNLYKEIGQLHTIPHTLFSGRPRIVGPTTGHFGNVQKIGCTVLNRGLMITRLTDDPRSV